MTDKSKPVKEKKGTRTSQRTKKDGPNITDYYDTANSGEEDNVNAPVNTGASSSQNGDQGIHKKLDNITRMLETVVSRLDGVEQKLHLYEAEQSVIKEKVRVIDQGMEELNTSVEELKSAQADFVSKFKLAELEMKVDDLENRSRRNNLVIWGIPEESEGETGDCQEFIRDFFSNHMNLQGDIEIERAHRSPAGKYAKAQAQRRGKPRPIHVKLLRYGDREKVLRSAPKSLKNKPYNGQNVFIADDVSAKVREERKKLIAERNKMRGDGKFAMVPWTVPACLLVKSHDGNLKRMSVEDVFGHL